jgi:hypothetical protein
VSSDYVYEEDGDYLDNHHIGKYNSLLYVQRKKERVQEANSLNSIFNKYSSKESAVSSRLATSSSRRRIKKIVKATKNDALYDASSQIEPLVGQTAGFLFNLFFQNFFASTPVKQEQYYVVDRSYDSLDGFSLQKVQAMFMAVAIVFVAIFSLRLKK